MSKDMRPDEGSECKAQVLGSGLMSNISDEKIRRWRLRIEECRLEAESLGPDGRHTMQTVIESYERLIAMVQGLNQPEPG
jgi:hypothetical protein